MALHDAPLRVRPRVSIRSSLELDDRFHETGGHGTNDLLVDSSFAIG